MPEKTVNTAKVDKLLALFEVANKDYISYEEARSLLQSLITPLNDLKAQLIKENKESNNQLVESLSKTIRKVEEQYSKISDSLKKVEKESKKRNEEIRQEMVAMFKTIEDAIPDTTYLHLKVDELEDTVNNTEIPEEYDDSKVCEELEELEDRVELLFEEIENLKKYRPLIGAGVSNMRIQQAFKYILKTEQPVGDIDGANKTYTLTQPIFAILSMSINGETIAQLPNYTIAGKTFTFSVALPSDYSGKDWEVKYI